MTSISTYRWDKASPIGYRGYSGTYTCKPRLWCWRKLIGNWLNLGVQTNNPPHKKISTLAQCHQNGATARDSSPVPIYGIQDMVLIEIPTLAISESHRNSFSKMGSTSTGISIGLVIFLSTQHKTFLLFSSWTSSGDVKSILDSLSKLRSPLSATLCYLWDSLRVSDLVQASVFVVRAFVHSVWSAAFWKINRMKAIDTRTRDQLRRIDSRRPNVSLFHNAHRLTL